MKLLFPLISGTLGIALAACATPPPQASSRSLTTPTPPPAITQSAARHIIDVADTPTTASLTIDDAVNLAVARNPRLLADHRRVEALLLEVPQVTSLDDPMAEVEWRESFRGPDDDRENMARLSQTFPWFGKRRLRGLVAGSEAAEALAEYQMAVLDTRRDVQGAWWRVVYARHNAALLNEERRLVEEARSATLALYQSGQSDRSALVRLDAEAAMITGLLDENAGLARAARHELERLLVMPLGEATIADPPDINASRALPAVDALVDAALEHRPELAVYAEAGKRAGLQERLARADYYPDFTLGVGMTGMGMRSASIYEFDSDDRTDSWQASVGINIPIPNARRRAAVAQARVRAEEARLRGQATADQVVQEIATAHAMASALEKQQRLYADNVVPLASEAYAATRSAYQSGTATYADLIDVQRALVAARREHLRLRRDLALAVVELTRAAGAPLDLATAQEAVVE